MLICKFDSGVPEHKIVLQSRRNSKDGEHNYCRAEKETCIGKAKEATNEFYAKKGGILKAQQSNMCQCQFFVITCGKSEQVLSQ